MAYDDEARERDRAALAWWLGGPDTWGSAGWTVRDAEIAIAMLRRRAASNPRNLADNELENGP